MANYERYVLDIFIAEHIAQIVSEWFQFFTNVWHKKGLQTKHVYSK